MDRSIDPEPSRPRMFGGSIESAELSWEWQQKYHWDLDPNQLSGPFYAVRPQVAFGWHFEELEINRESTALENATR